MMTSELTEDEVKALRDIPAQAGFPHAVTWPQEP